MDVVQWKREENVIVAIPFPSRDERCHLSAHVGVGGDHALGFSGSSAGVDHQGPPPLGHVGKSGCRCVAEVSRGHQEPPCWADCPSDGFLEFGIGNDNRRVGVLDDVAQFRHRMRDGQRHGDPTCAPDPPLHGHVVETRWDEKRHASLLEIRPAGQDARSDPS